MFNLIYTQRSIRDLRKLDGPTKLRIGKALLRFREDPLKYAEKITDHTLGSYRFGLAIIEWYLTCKVRRSWS